MLGGTEVMPSQIMGSMSTGGAPDMSSMPPEVMMRMMEMQGGSGDMFSSPPGVGPGGAPPGGWGEGLGPNGGIGGGPTPGEAVPNAPSIRLYEPGASSTSSITLSEMFDGEVITCLAFGSCSCNMFRESQREYERMARELGGERRVRFITVYISEAHPKDGWSFGAMTGRWDIIQPKTLSERKSACRTWMSTLARGGSTYWVDGIDNKAKMTFMAAPDRLYIVDPCGIVQYQGAPGPFGWDIQGFRQALMGLL